MAEEPEVYVWGKPGEILFSLVSLRHRSPRAEISIRLIHRAIRNGGEAEYRGSRAVIDDEGVSFIGDIAIGLAQEEH